MLLPFLLVEVDLHLLIIILDCQGTVCACVIVCSVAKTSDRQTAANWLFFACSMWLRSSPIFIKSSYTQFLTLGCFSTVKYSKSPNRVEKQLQFWLPHTIFIDCASGRPNPWNWWKECSWTLKRLQNSLNRQETGKFGKKKKKKKKKLLGPDRWKVAQF